MDKTELVNLIETCWAAASEAHMEWIGGMAAGTNLAGQQLLDTVRLQTYFALLSGSMAPRKMTVNHETPKEPWQE